MRTTPSALIYSLLTIIIFLKFDKTKIFLMSIAEMKLKAIEKIKSLDNEETLRNILSELDKSENKLEKVYNLSQHFESISMRYDKTLKKLAK